MIATTRRIFVARLASLATVAAAAPLSCTDPDGDGDEGGGGSSSGGSLGSSGEAPPPGTTDAIATDSGEGTSGSGEGTDTAADETGSTSTGNEVCAPTAPDIEGPFYRPEIPIGGDLDQWDDEGEPLRLLGVVRDEGCEPIAGAVVEIWHATPVPPGGVAGRTPDATYDATREYRYYGQVATEADGSFEFRTLRPGWYLNGAAYRPAHIHVKVWVRGTERLTTQLYFVGDPFNEGDQWFNPDLALDPDDDGTAQIELTV